MYKVLIVDDDMIVRVGIKMIADWKKYGMEVVGETSDGQQALEFFHLYHPDLVFTDIKMPRMDGIELLQRIREHSKDTRVILLTNFDDKENIKEALRYGANDFISKNELNDEVLEALLKKEAAELRKNGTEDIEYQPSFETKKKIVSFFMESVSRDEKYEKEFLEKFNIEPKGVFQAGIIQVSHKKEYVESVEEETAAIVKLMQVIAGVLTEYPQSFLWENQWKIIRIFVIDVTGKLNDTRFSELCNSIGDVIRLYTKITTHVCASGLAEKLDDMYLLKNQLDKAVLSATFFSENKVVLYRQLDGNSVGYSIRHRNILKQMYACGPEQYQKVRDICTYIIAEAAREKNISLKSLLCSEFVAWYRRVVNILEAATGKKAAVTDYNLLLSAFDDDELQEKIDLLLNHIEKLNQEIQFTGNEAINSILFYISQNYASPLSLRDVAEYVHLSKNYVSTLFNNSMKESFAEYLSRFRIEKAKEILKLTDYRINEVSELVGFSSEKYFSVTFKSIVGISPTEYRQQEKEGP